MIKKCTVCENEIPALSCGSVCSPGCRTQSAKGVVYRAPKSVSKRRVKSKKVNLYDLFERAVAQQSGAFERFVDSVRHDSEMVEELAKVYFWQKYIEWEAERDKKPKCDYCGEIARDGSKFCSDECERDDTENEYRRRNEAERRVQRDKKRLEKGLPLKICYHCGSAFKTLDGHQVYCTVECRSLAREDRRENGPICVQCESRFRGTAGGGHYCPSCREEFSAEWRAKEQVKREKAQSEYEHMLVNAAIWREAREARERLRMLRSEVRPPTTEEQREHARKRNVEMRAALKIVKQLQQGIIP